MENKTVIVIGAANMDICGRPDFAPRLHDSNPGTLSFSAGGVGRNIAHNLRLMGLKVKLVAAIADDFYGEKLYKSCLELGMDMSLCKKIPGGRTSSYLYLTDENGDMLIGLADTEITNEISPGYLCGILGELNCADAVVIDGNLAPETVEWIAENVKAKLFADPVSCAKAARLKPAFPRLSAFKPNMLEAFKLTGECEPDKAAQSLLREGVERVFISLGADGIFAAENGREIKLPAANGKLVNATGCGDSATAAIIWAGVEGLDLEQSAKAALKAGAVTAACSESVSPDIGEITK